MDEDGLHVIRGDLGTGYFSRALQRKAACPFFPSSFRDYQNSCDSGTILRTRDDNPTKGGNNRGADSLNAMTISSENVLLGYLDLCGTKAVYETLELKDQLNRIIHAVSTAWTELSNVFGKDQQSLYVHMFADSLVIAQRKQNKPENCINKLVDYLVLVQFQMLRHSESFKIPLLSRCTVKKGRYFGILFDQTESKIDEMYMNLSLVGGPSVVEMDKLLKGLPVGVYIDHSLASQYADPIRLVPVEREELYFVRPPESFITFERFFGNFDFDTWIAEMIERSHSDQEFINKLQPWADVIQKRATSIQRVAHPS